MSKSIEEWWVCLGWRKWVEEVSGNIWLFIWLLHIHSAQRAGFGLPSSRLLAEKSKAAAHELVFIFSQVVWKHFLSCIFPPWPIFLVVIHFSFFFSHRRTAVCKSFASAGLSLPPCTLPHGKMTVQGSHHGSTSLLAHQAPSLLLGSGDDLETSKAWSQVHIGILTAHVSCAEFSVRDLWHIYSHHKKSSWVAGRSHSWVSPGVKLPTKIK